LSREAWGSCLSYLKSGGNQGWNIDHEDGWRDRDWCDQDPYWRNEDDDNDCYMHTYDRPKSKELFNVPKSGRIEGSAQGNEGRFFISE